MSAGVIRTFVALLLFPPAVRGLSFRFRNAYVDQVAPSSSRTSG